MHMVKKEYIVLGNVCLAVTNSSQFFQINVQHLTLEI